MKKILIVDDDQFLRDLYEEILKDAGYEVEMAVDGEDGLAKIQATAYDLVLLDIMMPKLDGIGVLKKLKETPPAHPNKIVLLTNLAHNLIIKEAMELGAVSYLIKADMTPDQLLDNIKKVI